MKLSCSNLALAVAALLPDLTKQNNIDKTLSLSGIKQLEASSKGTHVDIEEKKMMKKEEKEDKIEKATEKLNEDEEAMKKEIKDEEGIKVCPGEGPRYGDFKCNHDGTHRVCAQLLDE